MLGLVILFFAALYLLLSALVVWISVRLARKRGIKGWRYGLPAALLMYLIVFWDHIPTLLLHKYYCETEAGFWVYKTPEQWAKENPGVFEGLIANKGVPSRYEQTDDGHVETTTYFLNERFGWIVDHQDISKMFLIIRIEQQVKDIQKNEVLSRYVDFGAGNSVANTAGPPGPLKFWLSNRYCRGGKHNESLMGQFEHIFRGKKK